MRVSRLSFAAAALLLAAGATACSSSGPSATRTSAPAPHSSALTPGPTAPSGTNPFDRNEAWFSTLQSAFASIQSDTEHIKAAAGQQNVAALPRLCAQLKNDAVRVNGAPAAPDARLASAVSSAMSAYKSAADSCLKGDFSGAADGINSGGSYLQQANAILTNLAND